VLANNATVGVFMADATCKGALSLATTPRAMPTAAANPNKERAPAQLTT
jgi:hypothetical protein